MNKFEVVLIFNPDLSSNVFNYEIESFRSKIISQSAVIINEENWGLRDLSYNINKFKKAFYHFLQIEAQGNMIKEISKELNQSENLLRYIFIKVKQHQELPTKLNYEKKINLNIKERINLTHPSKTKENSALLVNLVHQLLTIKI